MRTPKRGRPPKDLAPEMKKASRTRRFKTWRKEREKIQAAVAKGNGKDAHRELTALFADAERRYVIWDYFTRIMPGATFRQIADVLHVSTEVVSREIWTVADELANESSNLAKRWRPVQVQRLESLILTHWTKKSDPRSARIIIQAIETQARLLGTEAPTKITATDISGTRPYASLTSDEIDARLRALASEVHEVDAQPVIEVEPSESESLLSASETERKILALAGRNDESEIPIDFGEVETDESETDPSDDDETDP